MVETFILNTDPLDSRELFEQLLEQVDDTRKEKILKLRTFTKQKQSLGAGLLIKKYVGDIHSLNKNGKPKNNNTEFNISHSGKYVVLTKGGTDPVGVDIELMQRGNKHIAPRFFTLDECVQIDRSYDPDKTFTQIWTLKEAFLKCIGSGVGKDLKRFTIHIDDEKSELTTESTEISTTLRNMMFPVINFLFVVKITDFRKLWKMLPMKSLN